MKIVLDTLLQDTVKRNIITRYVSFLFVSLSFPLLFENIINIYIIRLRRSYGTAGGLNS